MKMEIGEMYINRIGNASGLFMTRRNRHFNHSHEEKKNMGIGKVSGAGNHIYDAKGLLQDGDRVDQYSAPGRSRRIR